MKKWLAAIALIVCLAGWIGAMRFDSQTAKSDDDRVSAYVQRKLGISFDAARVEEEKAFYALADQSFSFKIWLSGDNASLPEKLADLGWNAGALPEAFAEEQVLNTGDAFDREIQNCCKYFDVLWTYVDEYQEFYGRRAYEDYEYGSPNFRLAVYLPECKLLFYKEYDS